MHRLERDYQPNLIKRIERLFPGCYIRKHDMQQGWPDLLILWGPHWALLEVKRTRPTSPRDFEPNQEWWIEEFNSMSFSACICPENEEEVLRDLQYAFQVRRPARASKR
jgi:hypothetical protein